MTPERWAEIEDLFARALEYTAPERANFLQQTCRDAALRREVETLLDEHESDPDFLSSSPWLDNAARSAAESHPAHIGQYRILRVLGHGGMGQVYLAERDAPGFRLSVALKVMRHGLESRDRVARFRVERKILATLNHPNIARLFDVGATEQGLPYFVMEYMEGVPILEYCDSRRLGVRERIGLFNTIADAVQHAHRSLIVHRDIKPQNILVTNEGIVKLLDFGIARILEPSGKYALHTRPELRIMTPDYAAPEQLLGQPVTTACDVYALGVLLFELLVGEHPFRNGHTSPADVQRRVLEIAPAPPSTRVAPANAQARNATVARLQRQLTGDLDAIVLKAMRKEPAERYASALSLSEDLERHLAGRPVHARTATAEYRARKFLARNRTSVIAGIGLFLVLMGATAYAMRCA